MASAFRSVYAQAPAEQVWDYLRTPSNIVEWWPDCQEIHEVVENGEAGCSFRWTDSPAGVVCHGAMEEEILSPGELMTLQLSGDLCGEMRWLVERVHGGALVTFRSDYDLPVRSLIPYLSPMRLLRFQQDEADTIAKKICEKFQGI